MSDFLRGNFTTKKSVQEKDVSAERTRSEEIAAHLREKALANICGSMVYVEKTELSWDGDDAK